VKRFEGCASPARVAGLLPFVPILDDCHLIAVEPIYEAVTFLPDHPVAKKHLSIYGHPDPPLSLIHWRA
jgi:hypothetical protein